MAKRTISIPDEIEERLRQLPEGEVSRYVVAAIEEKQHRDTTLDVLREAGYEVDPSAVQRRRRQFAANRAARAARVDSGEAKAS
jgi:hypothetical protein